MQHTKLSIPLLLIITIFLSHKIVQAQGESPQEPFYLVQEGDSLWGIASSFEVFLGDLQEINNISDPGQFASGMQLVIPDLEGISGQVNTREVQYGETLESISREYRIPVKTMARINRLVSPAELYAGARLVVPVSEEIFPSSSGVEPASGETLLEVALRYDQNPWVLVIDNEISGAWDAFPGMLVQVQQTDSPVSQGVSGALPAFISKIDITPLVLAQGKTLVIKLTAPVESKMTGKLANKTLDFFPYEDGFIAFQGIHTMMEPGLYPLSIEGETLDGKLFAFSQLVLVRSTDYIFDPVLNVDPATVDPAVTEPEAELWASLSVPVTTEKMWAGKFSNPVPLELAECWTSFFGNRRSYNGSEYKFFHSGLDFCGRVGTELYATAAGKVVFAGPLIVRGGVVVIDHGWGIYTAYDHLSEFLVKPGDQVQPGQVVGLGGNTGRTTGPHLHWEVWVGGVQVDPVDWLEIRYP
jgi:murein DD-endopeptidase MepM/ murein hydrolase activator NlpD